MDSERILHLLAKRLGQHASEQEIKELNDLLKSHPEFHFFTEILRSVEGEKQHYESAAHEEELIQKGWLRLEKKIPDNYKQLPFKRKQRRIPGRTYLLRAAIWTSLLLSGTAIFYIWQSKRKNEVVLKKKWVMVPYGAPEKKTLPDSSVVWLNAGSHISYADNFIQGNREIYLDGEACFDVRHDARHPLIVHAGNIIIHVLGTRFNIKAYDNENKIETTLIDGKVQVQIADNPDKKIVLTPHEKLTVINQKFDIKGRNLKKQKELSFQVKEVIPLQTETPIPEIAWLQDKLAFQNERFGDLARGLERRYNVHIVFKDTLLMKERLNGIFENESISKAMQLLQMTTSFHYKITGDTVYLKQ
ncbi:FecR family protein [Compostibacter hankyongensis]|uniref:FecR family protein n=1 Tax=Compostibacter hankyongensis TaxID=1007089 RepID=A0ABP8FZL5_9BACT